MQNHVKECVPSARKIRSRRTWRSIEEKDAKWNQQHVKKQPDNTTQEPTKKKIYTHADFWDLLPTTQDTEGDDNFYSPH